MAGSDELRTAPLRLLADTASVDTVVAAVVAAAAAAAAPLEGSVPVGSRLLCAIGQILTVQSNEPDASYADSGRCEAMR